MKTPSPVTDLISFTPPQVGLMLGASEATVRKAIRRGELDAFRIGTKDWRVTRKALAAYIARKEEENRQQRES